MFLECQVSVPSAATPGPDIEMHYNSERLRPKFASFENKPFFIMGNELAPSF
jgi:hypothetical protein